MAKNKATLKRKFKTVARAGASTKRKTKSAAKKRYKVLGSGLIKAGHSGKQHNTGKRRRSVKNALRRAGVIRKENMSNARECLPNDL